MSYESETIKAVVPRINSTFFLPALQREFVWTAKQVCELFDSLMRHYPISSFLFWHRNWGTINFSIDHLFSRDSFKKNVPDNVKELRDDFGNLALVIGDENSGKKDRPLGEWLATRSPEYLKRHLIPADSGLWKIERFEEFLVERRKLLRARLQQVFSSELS